MPRPFRVLPAVLAAAALLSAAATVPPVAAAAVGAAQPAAAGVQAQDPLRISIAELSPSVIPKQGVITVSGRVTNLSEETWTDLTVYPFASVEPIGGEAELAKAAESEPTDVVGNRILTEGAYDEIPDLAPGESARYRIRLKRGVLGQTIDGVPGVYWFGVHVLKEGDQFAAGRARTFLPLVPPRTEKSVKTVLVVPIRRPIEYDAEGRLGDIEAWSKNFAANGRLRQIIELAETSGDIPITWLVDPAVLDAAERLAAGNPGRDLSPNLPPPGEEPDETEEPTPTEGTGEEGSDEESSKALVEAGIAAEAFLTKATAVLKEGDVLALPYGDVDVAAAVSRDPELLTEARELATQSFAAREITAQPAVAPVTGFLSAGGITAQNPATNIMVSDEMLRDPDDSEAPTTLDASGHRVVLSDSGTSSGGPGPESRSGALAMRQRILADAATRVLTDSFQPLVVSLPAHWRPGPTWLSFFQGMNLPWLSLEPLSNAAATPPTKIAASRLVYPDNHFDRELRTPSFESARELVTAGTTLDRVLTRNDLVGDEVTRQALTSLGYGARADTLSARQGVERATSWIESLLGEVVVEAPPSVTMSSGNGKFSVNLQNRLDEPVTVRVEAELGDATGAIVIKGPESIDLDAGAQRTVLLDATSSKVGVHDVRLVVTDAEGTRLGSSDDMPIRAGQLGKTIWMILAGGGVLLFGAIAVRLVRRFRRTA